MGISFSGRIVESGNLQLIESCIINNDAKLYQRTCDAILSNFRDAIEGKNAPSRSTYELSLGKAPRRIGNHYYFTGDTSGINLAFKKAIKDSRNLNSRDLLLGSLGHELGHFYSTILFGPANVAPMWEELIADFMGGFLFGLDQDNNPQTEDMQLRGRLEYFPYLNRLNCQKHPKYYQPIPELGPEYFYEPLDGVHPFCAARNLAIRMGFAKGSRFMDLTKGTPFASVFGFDPQTRPVSLPVLKQIFEEFKHNYRIAFYGDQKLQSVAYLLAQYNGDPAKVYLPDN